MNNPKIHSRPRLGFLGVGWIGKNRMEAIARSGVAEIAAIADLSAAQATQASEEVPQALVCGTFEELLQADLDGLVIATPSALHCEQAISGLESGLAVFCQKPLGRTAVEARRVVATARDADKLLGLDLSYRHIPAMRKVRELCLAEELGTIYAAELVFHNAYGPDKPWFYDRKLSGGGCLIDLGIHLVDLALWSLDFPVVEKVVARLFQAGQPLTNKKTHANAVEDYATARLDLETGATVQITCSWKLPVGCDALISAAFYGTKGGAVFYNRDGSFYDFRSEKLQGTKRTLLADSGPGWGGLAAVEWAQRLAGGHKFDPEANRFAEVAAILEAIYSSAIVESQRLANNARPMIGEPTKAAVSAI